MIAEYATKLMNIVLLQLEHLRLYFCTYFIIIIDFTRPPIL